MLRIFPLYYGALLAIFVARHLSCWIRSQVPMHTWKSRMVYALYLQNWYILRNSRIWSNNMTWHFWSLAAEERFYLVWPWVARRVRSKMLFRISLLALLGSLVLRCAIMWQLGPAYSIYQTFLTPTRGDGLFMGAAMAAYSAEHGRVSLCAIAVMAASGILVIATILLLHPDTFVTGSGSVYVYTIGITGSGLVSGALVASTQYRVAGLTLLNYAWLRSAGKYSYGMYVYHDRHTAHLRSGGCELPIPGGTHFEA